MNERSLRRLVAVATLLLVGAPILAVGCSSDDEAPAEDVSDGGEATDASHGGTDARDAAVETRDAASDSRDGTTDASEGGSTIDSGDGGGDPTTDAGSPDGSSSPAWTTEDWGTCSATCAGGTQTRVVTCRQDGADVDSALCLDDAPPTVQACNENPCGTWVSDDWGACSDTCANGGGTQIRVNHCRIDEEDVDPSLCPDAPPPTSQSCNESCDVDIGAAHINGTCGVLGVIGPGFTLTAGPTEALPVGTTVVVNASGIANSGVWSVTGGQATVAVLSGTARLITLTAALPAGSTIAFRTTLSISVPFVLQAVTSVPDGYVSPTAKTTGSVLSTLVLCSAT